MPERTCLCAHCGAQFTAKRSDAVCCSHRCTMRHKKGTSFARSCLDCKADISSRMGNAKFCEPCSAERAKVHEATRKTKASAHIACGGCGTVFRTPQSAKYCSQPCAGKASRAKQLAVPVEKICPACGDKFTTHDKRRETCGTACRQWIRRPHARRRTPQRAVHKQRPEEARQQPKRQFRRFDRQCPTCNQSIPRARRNARYCSPDCRPTKHDGGRWTAPRSVRRREVNCAYCGDQFTAFQVNRRYCSEWCSDTGYNSRGDATAYARRLGRTCERCGTGIPKTARVNKRFCCESCQVCFNQEIRRARKRGLPSERISRAEIFVRDKYTCHICMKPIEDKPVLDHLIPLALKNSPGHVRENVAAAHAYCNGSKNARVRPEDYDLYIRLCLGGAVT